MLFIDEYDTPFIEAHALGFYDELRGGLASMLHTSLKTSNDLQYAMLTGIQRVAKENIFSDLNNPLVCTVKDREYAEYFGFTKQEVKELLDDRCMMATIWEELIFTIPGRLLIMSIVGSLSLTG